jgi:hypothetical protein
MFRLGPNQRRIREVPQHRITQDIQPEITNDQLITGYKQKYMLEFIARAINTSTTSLDMYHLWR